MPLKTNQQTLTTIEIHKKTCQQVPIIEKYNMTTSFNYRKKYEKTH